jgi:hypothetical protein
MKLTHKFAAMTPGKRPQDPHMNGTGLRFETQEHGGEYSDTMPQATKLTDDGEAIRNVCCEFVAACRRLELFSEASVAIDGSKFKAVNTRDRNFTQAKMQRRLAQIDDSIARYSLSRR